MNRSLSAIHRALSGSVATLLMLLSVVLPLLDQGGFAHETALESQHSASTCTTGHDHSVCTQAGHTLSIATAPAAVDPPLAVSTLRLAAIVAAAPSPRLLDGPPSRAPPRP